MESIFSCPTVGPRFSSHLPPPINHYPSPTNQQWLPSITSILHRCYFWHHRPYWLSRGTTCPKGQHCPLFMDWRFISCDSLINTMISMQWIGKDAECLTLCRPMNCSSESKENYRKPLIIADLQWQSLKPGPSRSLSRTPTYGCAVLPSPARCLRWGKQQGQAVYLPGTRSALSWRPDDTGTESRRRTGRHWAALWWAPWCLEWRQGYCSGSFLCLL